MKNATKHADELKSLLKKLLKEEKPADKQVYEPLRALVRAAMSYDVTDARAEEAMKVIEHEFVDLNELRVATELEIQEMLGQRYPDIEKRVAMFTQSLNFIFEKEGTLSLDRLKTISKRDARQFLRELPGMHPFVEAYVLLYSFDGHAVPVDNEILEFLIGKEIVEEGTTIDELQRFVEHHVKADECHNLFLSLRRAASEGEKKRKK